MTTAMPKLFSMNDGPIKGPRWELGIEEDGFPDALRMIQDTPRKLYGIGNASALIEGISIIGARKATPYGIDNAKRFGGIAAERGIVIISGGALGCDSAAHMAALEHETPTIVFLGGGCDEPYPRRNIPLFQRVVDAGGVLISENDWHFKPLPWTFRARNRFIAAMGKATLIVEAGLPSGTFSTADEALAAGREVLAVPGAITSKTSQGANRLIYQGATPIVDDESFCDVLFSLFGCMKEPTVQRAHADYEGFDEVALALFDAIRANPMTRDEMLRFVRNRLSGEDPLRWLSEVLLKAEIDKLVARYPDGRFSML